MSSRKANRLTFGGLLLLAPILLGGCSTEHIHEPWINAEQRGLVENELERSEEVSTRLRDRLARGQADR